MRTIACAALVLLLGSIVRAATVSAPHVTVNYDGIDLPQAESIAQTLSAAWTIYSDDFGFNMPGTIRCEVKCAPGNALRLFTDANDAVFLYIPDKSRLDPPSRSGVFNLYGLCHELGHIAMYRTIKPRPELSPSEATTEGWAQYAGSVVVDRVYEIKGQTLWYDPYDYRQDGMARLERAIRNGGSDIVRGAAQWRALEEIIGRKGFPAIFQAIADAKITDPRNPNAAIIAALAAAAPEKKDQLELWWTRSSALLLTSASPTIDFKVETIDPSRLTGRPTTMAWDEGTSDGARSIAGGGHARKFNLNAPTSAPAASQETLLTSGDRYLVAVWVYGSRYGPVQPPATQFDLALCDADLKPIASWKKPFAAFDRSPNNKWVRLEVPATRLPPSGQFAICLNFRPTATSGVYVHFDSSRHGDSFNALPGQAGKITPESQGEWMIRVEVDQPAP
jgi:hypothetical protein